MGQVTESLARAILNGAGVTRNEVEQLARHFIKHRETIAACRALIDELRNDAARLQSIKGDEVIRYVGMARAVDANKLEKTIGAD